MYRPRPVPTQESAPSGLQQFDLLGCLLQRGQPLAAAAPADPRMLDEPLLLPLPPGAAAAGSAATLHNLQQQLCQLTTPECGAVPCAAPIEGFVGLRELAPQGAAVAASLSSLAPLPPPMQHAEQPAAPALPAFLLKAVQPQGEAEPVGQAAAAQPASQISPGVPSFLLEAPVLPAAAATRGAGLVAGAPASAFEALFQLLPLPAAAGEAQRLCLAPEDCQPASLARLLAQDMALEDGGLVLPAVQLEEDGSEACSGGCWDLRGC